jgi:hypothetical protein
MRRLKFLLLILPIGVLFATTSMNAQAVKPKLRADIITRSELPQFDTSRTYVFKHSEVHAESLLSAIVLADLPLERAWLPLDNLCMDPVGPRFTVELERHDPRIFEFGFAKGIGRLWCATELKLFTVER